MFIPSKEQLAKRTQAAIAESHAAGRPVCIERDGIIGDLYPDGTFKRRPVSKPRSGAARSAGKLLANAGRG